MVMDNYYNYSQHQFPPEMLWGEINSLHLSYLDMEESTEKIDHKDKLESCIHSYLCVAHHNQKFECSSTPQVLHKSARMPDFSGYKAAVGWDAIGRYAANLLMRPWRREYRQIKMYSGFYKHEVESNLVDADEMFLEMGYKHVDNQILKLTGPVCPDRLTSVSLDSIMAYVECQILKEIWEKVSQVCNVTWFDVLSLRETHAGSPQETITAMIYMNKMPPQVAAPAPKVVLPSYYPRPAISSMYPPAPAPNYCANNYYPPHSQYPLSGYSYNNIPSRPYYPQQAMHHPPSNHAHSTAQHNQQHSHGVPTGQLIELDAMYDQPDGGPSSSASPRTGHAEHNEMLKKMSQLYINDVKKPDPPSERDDGSGTYESWDYVYRNLESQGYSKDLGERGDLLQEVPAVQTKTRSKAVPQEKEDTQSKRERKESRLSTYDNVPEKKPSPRPPSERQHQESARSAPSTSNNTIQPTPKGWHCMTCTFLNVNDKDICEMCSKSRKKPVDEDLQVGGTQCEKCTFVNSKGQKICNMCSTNLNNSPTYI